MHIYTHMHTLHIRITLINNSVLWCTQLRESLFLRFLNIYFYRVFLILHMIFSHLKLNLVV
jgi:hypothetical protein